MVLPQDLPETDWGCDDWGLDPRVLAMEGEIARLHNELAQSEARVEAMLRYPSIDWLKATTPILKALAALAGLDRPKTVKAAKKGFDELQRYVDRLERQLALKEKEDG